MLDKLADLLIQLLRMIQFVCIVRDYESGVVLRFGRFNRLAQPGLVFIWPFAEEVLLTTTVKQALNVGPQSLTTKDGRSVVISTVITFSVVDCQVFLLQVEGAQHAIEDCTYGAVAKVIRSMTWEDLVLIDVDQAISNEVQPRAEEYGVEAFAKVSDLTMSDTVRLIQPSQNKFLEVRQAG